MTNGAGAAMGDSSARGNFESGQRRGVSSAKEDTFTVMGEVLESLPNASFKIKLENDRVILGYCSGKMKMNRIRILPGDRVEVEMTPYDMSRGRITYRHK